jgi:transposase
MSELKKSILEMHKRGYSYREIQAKLGCSKGTISYHVGNGQKEKTITNTRDKRSKIRKLIQETKHNKPCADCKEKYPYWIMEFDHLGDKLFEMSEFHHSTCDIEKVKKEINKCEIVCSNCHKNRTYKRQMKSGQGGGLIVEEI